MKYKIDNEKEITEEEISKWTSESIKKEEVSKRTLVKILVDKLSKYSKIVTGGGEQEESIIKLMNDLYIGECENTEYNPIIEDTLFKLYTKCKREEVLFTVGESISILGSGWFSKSIRSSFINDHEVEYFKNKIQLPGENEMEKILVKVIKGGILSTNGDEQLSGGIWLLSLIEFSADHEMIKNKHLQSIQRGFTYLLSSPNELLQDIASRGLIVLYENCDNANFKKSLISSLVDSLSSSDTSSVPLQKHSRNDDTNQLFPPGLLGSLPGLYFPSPLPSPLSFPFPLSFIPLFLSSMYHCTLLYPSPLSLFPHLFPPYSIH